jgi:hypothetical protein
VVTSEAIQKFAAGQDIMSIEGSAKTGQRTRDAFEMMGELIPQTRNRFPEVVIIGRDTKKEKEICC